VVNGRKLRRNFADAGDIATGVSQAVNQAHRNWIGTCDRNHREI
jgi:hypothetical protein